jgi:hypothetical protein
MNRRSWLTQMFGMLTLPVWFGRAAIASESQVPQPASPPIQRDDRKLLRDALACSRPRIDEPAAISIPFSTLPANLYIRGPRYRVQFDRIVTPKFTKDVDELDVWNKQAEAITKLRS